MEKIESRARRMGFTMLEIIVVMGIIGNNVARRTPIMPITTNISMMVKPTHDLRDTNLFIASSFPFYTLSVQYSPLERSTSMRRA